MKACGPCCDKTDGYEGVWTMLPRAKCMGVTISVKRLVGLQAVRSDASSGQAVPPPLQQKFVADFLLQ